MVRCDLPGVEAVVAASSRSFARHIHDQFGIGLIASGAQKSWSGRGMVEAGAGDMVTVNPGEVHDGSPIGDHGRAWRMLYLDPALVAAAIGDITEGGTRPAEFTQPVIRDARLASHFHGLFRAVTAGGPGAPMLRDEMLLTLLAGAMRRGLAPVPTPSAAIERARQRIDDDPAAALTLSELAQPNGLSRFQLLRAFARATGLTPHAYQVQRRIQLARRLIAGGVTLAEAAVASGFSDQAHMTRLFVRSRGISPAVYAAAVR